MERIDIIKVNKGFVKFFIISGLLFFVFGMVFLIYSLLNDFRTDFPGGDWNYIIYTIQGLLFFFIGYSMSKNKKYFIEWDNEELRYLLPKNKFPETIRLAEIQSIEVKLHEIKIVLPKSEKHLILKDMGFNELKRIKEKFEELKNNTDKIQTH